MISGVNHLIGHLNLSVNVQASTSDLACIILRGALRTDSAVHSRNLLTLRVLKVISPDLLLLQ